MNRYEDRYDRVRLLGAGAAGEVHLALDKATGRQVAVKLLLAGASSIPQARERFVQEAMILARVRHPNVVQVYDAGLKADGTPYLAMELLSGTDLAEYVPAHAPLAWERLRELAIGLGRGLEAIHAAGIVHRDMKPANALIDTRGVPRISDFGLAKDLAGSAIRTKTGMVLGTPGYLSPESLRGEKPGPPADVYALGLVFYFLEVGTLPWTSEELPLVLREQMAGVPVPCLARLPGPLGPLVARMVSLDPGLRPRAGEVAAALEAAPSLVRPRVSDPPRKPLPDLVDRARTRAIGSGSGAPAASTGRLLTMAATSPAAAPSPARKTPLLLLLAAGLALFLLRSMGNPGVPPGALPGPVPGDPLGPMDLQVDAVLGRGLDSCYDRVTADLKSAREARTFGSRADLVAGAFPNPAAWRGQRGWLEGALAGLDGFRELRGLLAGFDPGWWARADSEPSRARRAGLARILAELSRFDLLARFLSRKGTASREPVGGSVVPGIARALAPALEIRERLDLDGRADCVLGKGELLLDTCRAIAAVAESPAVARAVTRFNNGAIRTGFADLLIDQMYCAPGIEIVPELVFRGQGVVAPAPPAARVGLVITLRDLELSDFVVVELRRGKETLVAVPLAAGGVPLDKMDPALSKPGLWASYTFQVLAATASLDPPPDNLVIRLGELLDDGSTHSDHHVTVTGVSRWDGDLPARPDDAGCERLLAEARRQAAPDSQS